MLQTKELPGRRCRGVFFFMPSLTDLIPPRFYFQFFFLVLLGCQDVVRGSNQTLGAPTSIAVAKIQPPEQARSLRSEVASLGRNLSGIRRGLTNQETRIEEIRKGLQSLMDGLVKNKEKLIFISVNIKNQMKELRSRIDGMDSELAFLRVSGGRSGLVIEKEELDIQIRPAGVPAEFSSGGNLKEGSVKTESAVGVSKETPIAAGIPKGVTQDVVLVVPPVGMPAEVPLSPKSIKPNPEDEYNEALRILNEEHSYPRARLIFNRFVSKNTTHELADDAQYWIGESYFQEKKFERAILAFNKVQVDYANGDKAPDALLKEALAFLNLGDKASARELLARVIQKYPNSSVAIAATEQLKSL